ncbi:MAG: TrkA family potassium uptake protein [Bacillota bacterium]|jgi:trk system potassium uptake protein TrkA|nr:TrkA family potassium uptake protein [Bacillota bacterium]
MKQFIIIGIGKFGESIATNLYKMGHDVLAVDIDEERVQHIANKVTHAVQADATEEGTLEALGVKHFDGAVVTIGESVQASILITLLCKELGIRHVLAKAQNELHAKVLYKIGADRVVFPERDMGLRVAHSLVSTSFLDYIELTPDYSIVELKAAKDWQGKSLKDLNIRAKYGINIMAIKQDDKVVVSPAADDVIQRDDVLVVIGKAEDINRFQENSYD